MEASDLSRRDLLKLGAAAGVGAPLPACASSAAPQGEPASAFCAPPLETVRVGVVGVGGMGRHHVRILCKLAGVEVRAICDLSADAAGRAQDIVAKVGQRRPTAYTEGPTDYERMCAEAEIDLVYCATPWRFHVPVCVAAMENGKHAATEVPAAITTDGAWKLVETAERTRRHCVMLENCAYDRPEMLCLNLVRQGVLGEVLHGECGYLHDLRPIKFAKRGEGRWRRKWSTKRNANLYPTHGLGPVAQCMDINRGDRFDYLVSMSGPSRGLQNWQREHLADDDPRRAERYVLGDVNVSLLKTVRGKTVYLVHDTNLPRPYSRLHIVQGTRGIFERWPERVHVEGRSKPHAWDELDAWKEYEHPLWLSEDVKKASGGHGGMDLLESYRLVKCLQQGLPTDMDVYDAAAWSVIVELSERSVADRSATVDFPDFTRGRWKTREPLGIVGA